MAYRLPSGEQFVAIAVGGKRQGTLLGQAALKGMFRVIYAIRYAVTLEFLEAPPETVRGELTVANARLGARRAVEAALRAHPRRHWSGLSVPIKREVTA